MRQAIILATSIDTILYKAVNYCLYPAGSTRCSEVTQAMEQNFMQLA